MECEVCGAPASVAWTGDAKGVDNDGADAIVTLSRVNCAAGHWYTATQFISDPLDTEDEDRIIGEALADEARA